MSELQQPEIFPTFAEEPSHLNSLDVSLVQSKKKGDPVLETLPRDVVVAEVSRHYRDDIEHRKVENRDWYDRYLEHLQGKYKLSNEQDLLRKEEAEVVDSVLQDLGFTSGAVQSVEISPRPRTHRYLFDMSGLSSEKAAVVLSKAKK